MLWKSKISYLALLYTVVMTACDPEVDQNPYPDTFSNEKYAVYMAYTYDSIPSASAKKILCSGVWCNARSSAEAPTIRKLSPGRDEGVEVSDICVKDNKVYVAGCFGNVAAYWEDDKEVELPEGRGALGIGVDSKGVVYTCGFQKEGYDESAKMWEGTNPRILKYGARAQKLSICNDKCYIAGYGIDADRGDVVEARIWIDGQAYNRLTQDHENDNGDYPACANDIASDGDNWWCVGHEGTFGVLHLPKVWINRSNNNLKREGSSSSLTCIKYENGVFYIGGNDGFHAMYWAATQKSNKENRISNYKEYDLSTSGSTQSLVEDIDVLNGIVVCCGTEATASGSIIPKLWINGTIYSLGEQINNYSNVRPRAVAIVKRK